MPRTTWDQTPRRRRRRDTAISSPPAAQYRDQPTRRGRPRQETIDASYAEDLCVVEAIRALLASIRTARPAGWQPARWGLPAPMPLLLTARAAVEPRCRLAYAACRR